MSIENHPVGRDTYNEDEISLYDLYRVLAKRKKLIGLIIAVVLIISVVYILVAPKVYQVKTVILPPTSGDIYLTNIDVSDDFKFKTEDIFQSYTQEIMSDERWNNFTQGHKALFAHDSNIPQGSPFKLEEDKNFPGKNMLVSYDTTNSDNAALVFRQYLEFAEQGLVKTLTQQIGQYVKHAEKKLDSKIQDERYIAKQQRLDKIERLKNDLVVAKKLGIVDNLYFPTTGKFAGNKAGVFNVFANNTKTPTYLRGTKAISAELVSLEKRKSDDAYISNLREQQGQLLRLQQVEYTPDTFHAYRLSGEIAEPHYPVKPKKKLILVLCVVLGSFLGIFVAFIAEFMAKAREQDANN